MASGSICTWGSTHYETLDLMQLGCVYLYAFASLPIIQLLKWVRMKLRKRGE